MIPKADAVSDDFSKFICQMLAPSVLFASQPLSLSVSGLVWNRSDSYLVGPMKYTLYLLEVSCANNLITNYKTDALSGQILQNHKTTGSNYYLYITIIQPLITRHGT